MAGAGRTLAGSPLEASWDTALAGEMKRVGLCIEEELVLIELLADLAGGDPDLG
jgi:hypothetical protein